MGALPSAAAAARRSGRLHAGATIKTCFTCTLAPNGSVCCSSHMVAVGGGGSTTCRILPRFHGSAFKWRQGRWKQVCLGSRGLASVRSTPPSCSSGQMAGERRVKIAEDAPPPESHAGRRKGCQCPPSSDVSSLGSNVFANSESAPSAVWLKQLRR